MDTRRRFAIGGASTALASVAVLGLVAAGHSVVLADSPGVPVGVPTIELPAAGSPVSDAAPPPAVLPAGRVPAPDAVPGDDEAAPGTTPAMSAARDRATLPEAARAAADRLAGRAAQRPVPETVPAPAAGSLPTPLKDAPAAGAPVPAAPPASGTVDDGSGRLVAPSSDESTFQAKSSPGQAKPSHPGPPPHAAAGGAGKDSPAPVPRTGPRADQAGPPAGVGEKRNQSRDSPDQRD
ncbi:hypothetical protein [Microbacterium aureliae]